MEKVTQFIRHMTPRENLYTGQFGWKRSDTGRAYRFQIISAHEKSDGAVDCLVKYIKTAKLEIIPSQEVWIYA